MRASEILLEYRGGVMDILRDELPGWPDYVIKDMIGAKIKSPQDLEKKLGHVRELAKEVTSWRLVQAMPLTFNMLDPDTQNRMRLRKFGDANPFKIPNDRERFEHALELVKTKGMENLPPVIFKQTPNGLDLWEGWHRMLAAFRLNPKMFRVNAWIGTGPQNVQEVQILSKVKGKGAEPSQLPKRGLPIKPGEEPRYLGQKIGDLKGLEIWRDWVGGQVSYQLFDPSTRQVVLVAFGSRYQQNPQSFIISGVYASPASPVRAAEFYRALILDQGLTLISDRKQSPGGQRVWQQLEKFPDIEVYGYDTKTGEVLNIGASDEEMYAVPPMKGRQERDTRQTARNIRLVATAR